MKLTARDVRFWKDLNSHGVSSVQGLLGLFWLGIAVSHGHFRQKRGRFELELSLSMGFGLKSLLINLPLI